MNIRMSVSFHIMIFFGCMPRSGLPDHMVALFLVSWGTSILFSIVATPIYIPTSSVGEPPWKVIISSVLRSFETLLRQNI